MKSEVHLIIILIVLFVLSLFIVTPVEAQSREEIIQTIRLSAVKHDMNPDLLVAIATVESNLNPKARGSLGEVGVFQLRPEYHNVAAGNFAQNIEVAVAYLADIKAKWEPVYGDAWFIKFNLGPNYRRLNHPALFPYYRKVMSARTIASH